MGTKNDTKTVSIEEIENKRVMSLTLEGIGFVYLIIDNHDKALDYFERSLAIAEELGDNSGISLGITGIGFVYFYKGDYKKAEEYLEKSLALANESGIDLNSFIFETTTRLYLTYKYLDKEYDVNEIHSLNKEAEQIRYDLNYHLYQLLKDKSYLETAYNQVQEKASAMDNATKFLEFRIPKAIVEEWERVK